MRRIIPTITALALFAAAIALGVSAMHEPIEPKGFWTPTTGNGIVYVDSALTGSFRNALHTSIPFVNRYTGSTMVLHKCTTGHRCIRIRFGTAPGKATGWTTRHGNDYLIIVEGRVPSRFRVELLDHELGHAHGLADNKHCVSRMFPYVTCHGRLTPRTYTRSERKTLRLY